MDVTLVCGFLGAGKTTLVRRLLTERKGNERLAVIVNEFGQVGIDGQILRGGSVDLIELTAGCFCCVLKGSLVSAIEELRDKTKADRVVIEASGVSQPRELLEVFRDPAIRDAVALGPVVTVVDTARFRAHRRVLGGFYTEQVRYADVVLLNKRDLASADELVSVQGELASLAPRATVVATERCGVELETIMAEARRGAGEPSALEQGLASPAPAASFMSFMIPATFDAARPGVERFFASLPESIVRAKGFMTIDGAPHLVQFAAGQLEIKPAVPPRSPGMVFISSTEPDRAGLEAAFRKTAR